MTTQDDALADIDDVWVADPTGRGQLRIERRIAAELAGNFTQRIAEPDDVDVDCSALLGLSVTS